MKPDDFRLFVRQQSRLADDAIGRVAEALRLRQADRLQRSVCECVFHKFLLETPPDADDGFDTLALQSTQRTLLLAEGDLSAGDISAGCLEADTSDAKKILFILMLKRRLNVELAPEQTAEIDTIRQLCDALLASARTA